MGEARTASVIARPAHGEGAARRNPWPAYGSGVIPCHARRQRLGSRPSRRLERIAGREWGTAQPRALHRVGLGGDRGRGGRLRAHRSPTRRRTAVVGEARTVLSTPCFLSQPSACARAAPSKPAREHKMGRDHRRGRPQRNRGRLAGLRLARPLQDEPDRPGRHALDQEPLGLVRPRGQAERSLRERT